MQASPYFDSSNHLKNTSFTLLTFLWAFLCSFDLITITFLLDLLTAAQRHFFLHSILRLLGGNGYLLIEIYLLFFNKTLFLKSAKAVVRTRSFLLVITVLILIKDLHGLFGNRVSFNNYLWITEGLKLESAPSKRQDDSAEARKVKFLILY